MQCKCVGNKTSRKHFVSNQIHSIFSREDLNQPILAVNWRHTLNGFVDQEWIGTQASASYRPSLDGPSADYTPIPCNVLDHNRTSWKNKNIEGSKIGLQSKRCLFTTPCCVQLKRFVKSPNLLTQELQRYWRINLVILATLVIKKTREDRFYTIHLLTWWKKMASYLKWGPSSILLRMNSLFWS